MDMFADAEAGSRGPTSGSADRAPWTGYLVVLMAATVLLYGLDIWFQPVTSDLSDAFQKFASAWIFFGAAVLCVAKGRGAGGERSAWWLFALAMAFWGTASTYYSLFLWDSEVVPIPSIADGFWLAFYVPAYMALYKLLRSRAGRFPRAVWFDAVFGGLGVGGAAAALVFGVILDRTHGSVAMTATNLAYPVGDIGLLAMVGAAITVVGWRASGAWRWIAAAFTVFAVADGIWLVQGATGSYILGGTLDLGWPVAALLVGLAAWRREPRVQPALRRDSSGVVPTIVGLAAIALLAGDHFIRTNPLALGLASILLLVMIARLYLAGKDNVGLLARSRREAMTDALTGLGNRRQLTADLSAHVGEIDRDRPLMLTLFDLDGFKDYNDTFGHVAGDQLLERLGARLSDLLAGRGTAYRMGGDEFCALWHRADAGQASVTTMEAQTALSEQGEGFSIGCSYGSVLLPNEATDPLDALRTADRRMYARKRSGRASAGRQSSDVLTSALLECDSELGVHLGSVAELVTATAIRLDLSEPDLGVARQTALLHDVGKVAIPDEILTKRGPLDQGERAFIKRHTLIGQRIVSAAPALAEVGRLVRSTHERFDGAGYPDGLAKEDIPLIARIISVCDAYDAMVSERTYREARDSTTAVAELRNCSGTQFDPAVVEALVSALATLRPGPQPRTARPSEAETTEWSIAAN